MLFYFIVRPGRLESRIDSGRQAPGFRVPVRWIAAWSVAAAMAVSLPASGQTITVTGTWNLTVGEANLTGGAGTDLTDTYESATNQVICDVNGASFKKTWAVYVHMTGGWDSRLRLDTRRQAYNNLVGGTAYFELTTTDQEFFYTTVKRAANGIQIQFRLRGMSLQVPIGTHSTTVVYTLVDI
jgi:hypothetical protein